MIDVRYKLKPWSVISNYSVCTHSLQTKLFENCMIKSMAVLTYMILDVYYKIVEYKYFYLTSLWYLESKTCLTVCDTILAFSFTFYECVFLLIYIIVNTHIPAHNSHSYLGSTKQHIICYAVQYGYLNYLRKCIVHLF